MGKKRGRSDEGRKYKKGKYSNAQNVEPGWMGIYATYVRGKDAQCRNELKKVFTEYGEEIYGDKLYESGAAEEKEEEENEEEKEDDIEAELAKEINELKETRGSKTEQFRPIDLGCECVIFFRTRKPVDPVEFVKKVCEDAQDNGAKKTRYAQRLTPITRTATANIDGLKRLAGEVLKEHFHKDREQEPVKFAIRPQIRNHNILSRSDIIETVAECINGREYGHRVDLKNYDKLVLIECFKSSVGMAVVNNDFDKLERFNLQQIYEKQIDSDN